MTLKTKHIDEHFLQTMKHFVYTSTGKLFEQNSRDMQIVYLWLGSAHQFYVHMIIFLSQGETSQRFYEFLFCSLKN